MPEFQYNYPSKKQNIHSIKEKHKNRFIRVKKKYPAKPRMSFQLPLYATFSVTIEGVVSSVELYSYKVTWTYYNSIPEDFIEACKTAIKDEVDIIFITLSIRDKNRFYMSVIALSSFFAMKHGILTVVIGSNHSSLNKTVRNVVPWMLTVVALTSKKKTFRTWNI